MRSISEVLVSNEVVSCNFKNLFTWASGIQSPIYCDCRELIGMPIARKIILDCFLENIKKLPISPQIIAGTATAGIPWATLVANALDLPLLYVRSKPKDHGNQKKVEGKTQIQNPQIFLIEDTISTAKSVIESAQALETELKASVIGIGSIFTWSLPLADKNLNGYQYFSLTKFELLIECLRETENISASECRLLQDFHKKNLNA